MQRQNIVLLVGSLLLSVAAAIVIPQAFQSDDPSPMRWTEADEQVIADDADANVATTATLDSTERTAGEAAQALAPDEARVAVLLRGRVVDRFQRPVSAAQVWLDFGRAGARGGPMARQRRVPDPVQTDEQGRFAFAGQTFRNLQVALQVLHETHAPGVFDKFVGEVRSNDGASEIDLGDLVLTQGGELVGRVTDLEGNGIPGADLELQAENGNPMRMVRDRASFFAPFTTDQNGYFRRPNLTAGDWSVTATAKQHTEGRSAVFAAENEQTIDIEDIRLGPGYEVTGYVRDVQGAPIAKAEVRLRAEARDRERRGGPGGPGAGREHRATTDGAGRFSLEHLPGTPMTLDATAAGYLDTRVESVDPTVGQPLQITMPDGLRLTGVAIDTDGSPVATFAVRAIRRRALGAQPPADWQEMSARFRDMPPDEAMRQVRAQFEDRRRGEGGPGQRPGQAVRDLGKPESHPRGEFTITGLQEGVYEVFLQSPEHARFRSSEIDLRLGAAPPHVIAKLDGGVYVAGVVTDTKGAPIRDARVTLRPASLEEPSADGGRRGRARGAEMMMQFAAGMQSLEATTDREGEFVVKHVTRGTYRLQADANGFANASSEVFDLQADRSGFVLQLGPLGSITGVVRGLKEGEFAEARVGAVPIGNGGGPGMFGRGGGPGGMFRNAAVAADGSYTIEDLAPGDYVVRSWIGSPQDLMRELGPSFMDGSLAADVTVKAGDASRFDLAVTRPRVGIVAGSVFHNGTPAAGFHVELARATDDAARSAPGERGGRGLFANFGRTLQGVIAPSGQFRIANVPEGRYRLRVSTSRRGGAIFEETLDVAADVTVDRNLSVHTSTVQGVMTASDGTDVAQLAGRVSLLPNTSAMPQDGNGRPRNAASFDARLQGGVFHFDSVPPGNHLVVVTIRGRERTSQSVTVGTDGTTKVEMPVGKVTNEVPGAGRPAPTPRQGNVPTNR